MAKHYITQVILPQDWEEFSRNPRQYRRRDTTSGVLTISLLPAPWPPTDDGEELINHLHEILAKVNQEVGEEQYQGVSDGEADLIAHSLRRSETYGILCFWLLITNAKLMIHASFVMGDPNSVTADLQDAHAIIQGIYLTAKTDRGDYD